MPPKLAADSQAHPIDPTTGKPWVMPVVSPAEGVANSQGSANAIAPSPTTIVGTGKDHGNKNVKGQEGK